MARSASTRQQLAALDESMLRASSYEEWLSLAEQHDELSGAADWRRRESSRLYDYKNIRHRLRTLRKLRKSNDDRALLFALNEGIHGNMGGMGSSKLHRRAKAGTKFLIEEYVDEIAASLKHFSPINFKGISFAERLEFFQRASHCYGRSALMLSGGGMLGTFHLGLLKALLQAGVLPSVISGASAGSLMGAVVCTHSDAEFLALFDNDSLVEELSYSRMIGKANGNKSIEKIDLDMFKETLAHVVPDMTFQDAYHKTGRCLNISISPAEPRQSSRLLNHIASPNVTIRSAVLASCAIPGVFPPVQLEAIDDKGKLRPYLPSRRWVDGSISHDLPSKRLARLYGVNHFIVSQVMPGLSPVRSETNISSVVFDAWVAASKQLVRGSTDMLQRYQRLSPKLAATLNGVNSFLDQSFAGDINILPDNSLLDLTKVLKVWPKEEVLDFIRQGEIAGWEKIANIRITTQIGRLLDKVLHDFEMEEMHWLNTSPGSSSRPVRKKAKKKTEKKSEEKKKKKKKSNTEKRAKRLIGAKKSSVKKSIAKKSAAKKVGPKKRKQSSKLARKTVAASRSKTPTAKKKTRAHRRKRAASR